MDQQEALTTPADAAEWNAELVPGLGAARRRATLVRWRQGIGAWRRWADRVYALQSQIADTREKQLLAWLTFADFSKQAFVQAADFTALDFPSGASFENAQFLGDAWFCAASFGAGANFRRAVFTRDVLFEHGWFGGGRPF